LANNNPAQFGTLDNLIKNKIFTVHPSILCYNIQETGAYWMEATSTGKQSRKNDKVAGLNESQNHQVDADIPESYGSSDAVSAQGEDKNKKDRKSRQANKKEALFRKRQETRLLNLLLIIIRRFFPTLIE
jgi:hypothetical protein